MGEEAGQGIFQGIQVSCRWKAHFDAPFQIPLKACKCTVAQRTSKTPLKNLLIGVMIFLLHF